ncbi:hypothetical protein RchiOBHm_Chr6g0282451 [Rosa chinensis]|uniref:Uncharacterized protein n=1 Tax=Rosa chinensis TaxID=74649 RepID=A0A2P6PTV3_ROSCH|nr:hypothetical protein RchiOBHm_Chr6g0282451 [Rosa chinensis]
MPGTIHITDIPNSRISGILGTFSAFLSIFASCLVLWMAMGQVSFPSSDYNLVMEYCVHWLPNVLETIPSASNSMLLYRWEHTMACKHLSLES